MKVDEFQDKICQLRKDDKRSVYQLAVKMMDDVSHIVNIVAPAITNRTRKEVDPDALKASAAHLLIHIAMVCERENVKMFLLGKKFGEIRSNNHFLCLMDYVVSLQMDAAAFYDTLVDRRVKMNSKNDMDCHFDLISSEDNPYDKDKIYHLKSIYRTVTILLKLEKIPLADVFDHAVWVDETVKRVRD